MAKKYSIMQSEKECYITGSICDLQFHHIYFGKNRQNSDKHGFTVWLRSDWHTGNSGVHFNHKLDLQLKKECQSEFEKTHTRDEFMRIIGKSYL